jgi:uncharacterized repeat protein (TIGR03847 family)
VSESFELGAPDLFTAGAVGPPGQRVFFLQAREGGHLVTLKVEKEHVRALGEYLAGALAKLGRPGDAAPAAAPEAETVLVEPIVPAWTVRTIGVGYDETARRFVVVVQERIDDPEAAEAPEVEDAGRTEGEAATARFEITRAQAAGFVRRAEALMKAGRPPCPVCGQPKNPAGHICPRQNGHGRP